MIVVVGVVVDVVVVVVASQGAHFGLIVLRHTASLFCHQLGSQSSYGALVRCIQSLMPSSIDPPGPEACFFVFLFCCKHVRFAI